jgi:Type ISP C-terminal specificity domain/N-6 DNA Methylase
MAGGYQSGHRVAIGISQVAKRSRREPGCGVPRQNILSDYLSEIARIRATRAGTGEISYYGALTGALDAAGELVKPRVFCVPNLSSKGAGFPDMGLFVAARGLPVDDWPDARRPDRGVVEVDDIPASIGVKMGSDQVRRYLDNYGLVLVTNYRDFELLGLDPRGQSQRRENFSFGCNDAEAFFQLARSPSRPKGLAARFAEFLERVVLHQAPLARPEEVAFFLASYARDALTRVEEQATLPAFAELRDALQEALGLQFDGARGEHLFRSTLVQTLFYGLFSAWVESARGGEAVFDWRAAGWSLHVPFVDTLFQRIATPQYLKPLGLEEPLTWAADALNRVDRDAFFARFQEADAVRYFYEPFLNAFDPELRRQLGVWYTPREIVRYMVERVDHVLRTELGIADGLADESVWILDPCCGTGAYLVEVLDRIRRTLLEKGEDALLAEDLKKAAMTRVAGFEIMPAPYVIAHWQVGHVLRAAGVPLRNDERAAVYLTNSLTGWAAPEATEPPDARQRGIRYTYPPLAVERDEAARVKRGRPILVVLGNPPYNAFAGTSPAEESGLVEPYKEGLQGDWGVRKFNLDDLFVRFFRVAERRIAEGTGRGIVCFISNHSWLSYPSFVVMRERLAKEFDRIWIDNLNGSKFETGKVAPDGSPDPSVFSSETNHEGIQVGTAIALMAKKGGDSDPIIRHRNLWGPAKRELLESSLNVANFDRQYTAALPTVENRFSFRAIETSADYSTWAALPEVSGLEPFSGVLEKRRGSLLSFDRAELADRMKRYFDSDISFEELKSSGIGPVENMTGFAASDARARLLRAEIYSDNALRRVALHPFDTRWAYHTVVNPIWNRARPELVARAFEGNRFLVTRLRARRPEEGLPIFWTSFIPGDHLLDPNTHPMPVMASEQQANLSAAARAWLTRLKLPDPDADHAIAALPWHHVLAIGYSPAWLSENADGIRESWPRVPLPNNADLLRASAALGARAAALLDPDIPVPGVTSGTIAPALACIAVPSKRGGGAMTEADRAITAGWGHSGKNGAVMPGQGRIVMRDYAINEAAAAAIPQLGTPTNDVFLNAEAYWCNIPEAVWSFTIGGYQVLKKFLSYRERALLGRPLATAEVRYVRDVARRLAALRLLAPELDANYRACAAAHRPLHAP